MDIDFVDTQLVYLIYGDDKSYWHEAKFSILTALRECSKEERPRILIYTNKPNEFSDWPVDLIYLTQEILKQYSGEQHYFHRCKAVVMLDALNYAKKSIFIDTDTFFMSSPGCFLIFLIIMNGL